MRGLFASTLDLLGLFFVASLTCSVIIKSDGTTPDTTEDVSTIRYLQNAVRQIEEATTPTVPLPALDDDRSRFRSGNLTRITTEDTDTSPSLRSLIHNETGKLVQGADVSWLLDFAIIGFGKCGTSTVRVVLCYLMCSFV